MVQLKELLELMNNLKASDLVFAAGSPPMIRVGGEFQSIKYQPLL